MKPLIENYYTGFPHILLQVSFTLNILYYWDDTLVRINKPKCTHYCQLLLDSLGLSVPPFILPCEAVRVIISYYVFLGSSLLGQFLGLTLTVLRSSAQVFGIIPLSWNLSDIFLRDRLEFWVSGRKTTEVRFHSYHNTSRIQSYHRDLSLWTLNLVT